MSSIPAIGIDVGTTYCCVALQRHYNSKPEIIPNDRGRNTTPSFVAYDEDNYAYAGETAKDQACDYPDSTVFDIKRLIGKSFHDSDVQKFLAVWPFDLANVDGFVAIKIGEKQLLPQKIITQLLSHLLKSIQNVTGESVKSAVITVPAYFNELQHGLMKEACQQAGLTTVHLLNEPTAAAYAYGLHSASELSNTQTCLIFDLGGGTFDVTLFRLEPPNNLKILATGGDPRLGGEDFNDILTKYCITEFEKKHGINLLIGKEDENHEVRTKTARTLLRIRNECERQKVALTAARKVTISVYAVCGEMSLAVPMTRDIFESLIEEPLARCIPILNSTLSKGGVLKENVDKVILIGGSSRIPKVQDIVRAFFQGKQLLMSIHTDEAVACGAAVYAHSVFNSDDPTNLLTVTNVNKDLDLADFLKPLSLNPTSPPTTLPSELPSQARASAPDVNPSLKQKDESKATSPTPTEIETRLVPPENRPKTPNIFSKSDSNTQSPLEELKEVRDIIIKHKSILESNQVEQLYNWFKNFDCFERDYTNENISSFTTGIMSTALLESPLLVELAQTLLSKEKYNDSLLLYRKVFQIQTSTLGPDHLKTIDTELQIAIRLDEIHGEGPEGTTTTVALDAYNVVLAKRTRILGPRHQDTLKVRYYIAWISENHERYQEAADLAAELTQLQISILGENHFDVIQTQGLHAWSLYKLPNKTADINQKQKKLLEDLYEKQKTLTELNTKTDGTKCLIAGLLFEADEYQKALEILQTSYEFRNKEFGYNHKKTKYTESLLAQCLVKQNEFDKALTLYKPRLDQVIASDGEHSKDAINYRLNCAKVLQKAERYQEAIELFEASVVSHLATFEFGSSDLGSLHIKDMIGACLVKLKEYKKAMDIFTFIYEKRCTIQGLCHNDTLSAHLQMAWVLSKEEKHDEALEVYEAVHSVRISSLGPNHYQTLVAQLYLGRCLLELENFEKARDVLQDVSANLSSKFGLDNELLLGVNFKIGSVLYKLKKYQDAYGTFKTVFEIQTSKLGPTHEDTLLTQTQMAKCLTKMEQFTQAIEIFRTVYDLKCAEKGRTHPQSLARRLNLASAMYQQGNRLEALEMLKEIHSIQSSTLGSEHEDTMMTKLILVMPELFLLR